MLCPSRLLEPRPFALFRAASPYGLTLRLTKKAWFCPSSYGLMTAFHPGIDAAFHQKDLALPKFQWTDDRVSSKGLSSI